MIPACTSFSIRFHQALEHEKRIPMARTKRKGNQKKQQQPPVHHASVQNQVTNQAQHEDPAIHFAVLEEQVRLDELIVKDLMERRTSLAEEIETAR